MGARGGLLILLICLFGCGKRARGSEDAESQAEQSVPFLKETMETRDGEENRTDLPSAFDLRLVRSLTPVQDQGNFNTCWAFASLAALGSSMPSYLRTELSADHLTLRNSFGLPPDAGGDFSISSAYFLSWQGPVAEAEDPYGDGISPEGRKPVCHVQEIRILGERDYTAIKEAVFRYGGVQSSLYLPMDNAGEMKLYYKEETASLFYTGMEEANHDVVIVGWDDRYPKENFPAAPKRDGAFLCMNSWGESFGENGFFYVSYEDRQIGRNNACYTGIERADNYDRIYQTDLCGWTGQMGYGSPEAWFSNIYTAKGDEELAAVGFYATQPDTEYQVYTAVSRRAETPDGAAQGGNGVSDQPESPDEPMDSGVSDIGRMLAERTLAAEGILKEAGFYTVPLDVPAELSGGERFAVLVKIRTPGADQPAAMEYRAGSRTANVDIRDGEGYISFDGSTWQRTEEEMECNVCLKAYSRKSGPAISIR